MVLIKEITARGDTGKRPVALYAFPMFRFNIPSESVGDCVRLWISKVESRLQTVDGSIWCCVILQPVKSLHHHLDQYIDNTMGNSCKAHTLGYNN